MPLILRPELEVAWIDPALQAPEQVRELLKPDADSLVTRVVSTQVNSVSMAARKRGKLVTAAGDRHRGW